MLLVATWLSFPYLNEIGRSMEATVVFLQLWNWLLQLPVLVTTLSAGVVYWRSATREGGKLFFSAAILAGYVVFLSSNPAALVLTTRQGMEQYNKDGNFNNVAHSFLETSLGKAQHDATPLSEVKAKALTYVEDFKDLDLEETECASIIEEKLSKDYTLEDSTLKVLAKSVCKKKIN